MLAIKINYAAKAKNSINLYKLNISKKARLKLEIITRWSASYMMLESFQKAYLRKAFADDNPCPVKLETIELYMQILLPAFKFNLVMQKTSCSIADVVPNLLIMISKWNRMELTGVYKNLCNLLIAAFKHKFAYEMNSTVYSVASLINVSKLSAWLSRNDCIQFRQLGIQSVVPVAISFLEKKNEPTTEINNSEPKSSFTKSKY